MTGPTPGASIEISDHSYDPLPGHRDFETGMGGTPKPSRGFAWWAKRITVVGIVIGGGLAVGGYFLRDKLFGGSNNNDNGSSQPQLSCLGSVPGNITCATLPLSEPNTIIVNGQAINSGWTLQAECCPSTPIPGDICCPGSPVYNFTYWQFLANNVTNESSASSCGIGNVLAGSEEQAKLRTQAYFQLGPQVTGYNPTGIACADPEHKESQECIYSSGDTFPKSDPNYLTSYENIMLMCAEPSMFKGINTLFAKRPLRIQANAVEDQQQSELSPTIHN